MRNSDFKLLDGETIIGGSGNKSTVIDQGGFLLTNQRVIKVDRSTFGGDELIHTFNLEKLDSVQMGSHKNIILLVIGLIFFLIGSVMPILLLGSVACWVFFFLTKKRVISLISGNSKMMLNITPLAFSTATELVSEIEDAARKAINTQRDKQEKEENNNANLLNKLDQLKNAFDAGAISEEEYKVSKQNILNNI